MYRAKDKIETQAELEALVEYVEKRWVGLPNIREIFQLVWDRGLERSQFCVEKYGLTDIISDWSDERRDYANWEKAKSPLSKEQVENSIFSDAIENLGYNMLMGLNKVNDIVMKDWDYSKICKELVGEVKKLYPEATKARPKGWKALSKDYSDFKGMDEYCENQAHIDWDDFKGCNSNSAGASGFHGRVALPYVMYDDKCQGRKPLEVLVGAIFAHAYFVAGHNNKVDLINEITELKENLNQPQYYQEIQYEVPMDNVSPLLRAIVAVKNQKDRPTEHEFRQQLKDSWEAKLKFEQLSPEEKAIRKSEGAKAVQDILKNSFQKMGVDNAAVKKEKVQKKKTEAEIVWSILKPEGKKKKLSL